jgi:hypothetical protein
MRRDRGRVKDRLWRVGYKEIRYDIADTSACIAQLDLNRAIRTTSNLEVSIPVKHTHHLCQPRKDIEH